MRTGIRTGIGRETKPKYRKLSLKLREEFLNEIVHEEKYINEETFRIYFRYQKRSFLEKKLSKADKDKNDKIKYLIINELIK